MNEYLRALIFILLGFVGALIHYFKKRYIDKTIDISLFNYCITDLKFTWATFIAIVSSEIPLSLAQTGAVGVNELFGALAAGYVSDSGINRATKISIKKGNTL